MINHFYILTSVILWGISQFLVDLLLDTFTPPLLIFLRFFFSGFILLLFSHREKQPFQWKYILTGGLGAFGYYILSSYALQLSSVTFASIMGGCLPILAILVDKVVTKKKATKMQIIASALSLFGIILFSSGGNFNWTYKACLLMIMANLSWLFYGHLKRKWNIGDSIRILGYEFITAALLTIPFYQTFAILQPIRDHHILELISIIFVATIIPYWLYLKGSIHLSLNTASMYMNLLPVTSLIPIWIMGDLSLSWIQRIGVLILVLSAFA